MKITKLSLIAALAISAAFAGGDIEKPEVIIVPTPEVATTVDGLAKLYFMSNSTASTSGSAAGVTLNVTHKLFDGVKANFSAVGTMNFAPTTTADNITLEKTTADLSKNVDGATAGAFFNVANLTMTYGGTTLVAGRQLLASPLVGGYNWRMASGAFEAYTLVNSSISNLTLVGTYITKWRQNGAGDNWIDLTQIKNTAGNSANWGFGAIYNAADYGTLSAWYYNVDAHDYTQYYVDYGFKAYGMGVKAQYAGTTYATGNSRILNNGATSTSVYGVELSTEVYGMKLVAALNSFTDGNTEFIGTNGLYTTSWNTLSIAPALLQKTDTSATAYKVAISGDVFGLDTMISYAGYNTDNSDNGSELDVIVGYNYNKTIGAQVIYSSTTATGTTTANNVVEVALTYKF